VTTYDVEGIDFPRPFRIRRLGHFGFNLNSLDAGADFYGRLLGFRCTDEVRLGEFESELPPSLQDDRLIFMTHNTDHHALLLAHRSLGAMFGDDAGGADITLSQITWQVGSLHEVVNAVTYFDAKTTPIRRSGRDMPGSNWHVYVLDPDGHSVELYYGMEQVGINGRSKPRSFYDRRFETRPPVPQISDFDEMARATARGAKLADGYAIRELGGSERYDVAGVLLPRPFKVTKIGPIGIFVKDIEASEAFYRDVMGLMVTERVVYRGHTCVFMRHGNEHHSLKLYPRSLRAELGLSAHTTCASAGMQVGSYRQLREAVAWLKAQDVRFIDLPAELNPGIDYCAHIQDMDGHCVQLYYCMEQLGWDGRPRPASERRPIQQPWPERLPPLSDTYVDQTFMGPLG
jgi:catechol 2,3-dioxygenase-like lactoylglutathione lyase family enzyme